MRKLILTTAMLASLVAPMAAQAYPGELRDDRREIRQDRRELRDDRRDGDRREFREDRRELREDRGERREDRRDYRGDRDGYRGERRYHAGSYNYPRGYAYRAWGVGAYLPRAYWHSRYYVGSPATYGLPLAHAGTRWIRVGPDALLIRVRNGAVVRVVRGIYY